MGYLFENAEKMDIQAERRKTAEALQRLEEAERKIGHEKEQVIKGMIEILQECGIAKKQVIIKVAEKCGLTQQEAEKKVKMYWRE